MRRAWKPGASLATIYPRMSLPIFSRGAKATLFIGTGLAFSSAVSTVFVSMYLYRWLDGIAALSIFNLGQFILMPLGFYGAALVARLRGNRTALVLGLGLFVAFYGLLVLLGESSAAFLAPLGILNGLANGFFWFPFNLILARTADGEVDKGRFFGIWGALSSAANAVGPLVSTLAISLAPTPERGYALLFLSILIVTAAMAAAAFVLPDQPSPGPIGMLKSLRLRGAPGRWRFVLEAELAYGIRDGANWSIMSILILQGAGSETVAGALAIAFAVLGIGANYLVGATLSPRRSQSFWAWGSLIAVASALAIVLWPSLGGAIASGSLWKIAETLVLLPFNAAFYGILARYMREEGSVAGRNIAAELYLNIGRTIGAGAFLGLSFITTDYARILFPVVTLFVPLSWLAYKRHAPDIADH